MKLMMKLRGSSIITAREFVSFLKGEEHPYTKIIEGSKATCIILNGIFKLALAGLLDSEVPVVEFFKDGVTLTVKVRKRWNEWLEGLSLEDTVKFLKRLREILNASGFKQCKLQCSIHESDPEKTNIRIVYNPSWRRYENYEIFFRNKTQSRRKHS